MSVGNELDQIPAWLEAARMAPSAHNTQPWRFEQKENGAIAVSWDSQRTLPAGDPTNRDLYLGLGAAIESACLGAGAAGNPLVFLPAVSEKMRTVGYLVPGATAVDTNDLLLARSLYTRHTARIAHLPQPVPPEILESMCKEASIYGCELHVVINKGDIRKLARLGRLATASQFAEPAIQEELWKWLRLDSHEPGYRLDGLNAECMNLHGLALTIARLTMPPKRMRLLARVGLHHLLASETQWTLQRSASICLLTAPSSAQSDFLHAGRALLRIWLQATQAGLSTHPVSALLDCQATLTPTLTVFQVAEKTPASIFRLGATSPVSRSPRLPARELLFANEKDSYPQEEKSRNQQSVTWERRG